ncbi:MAG: HD domain-containing protein [Persicimonas sp.]
MHTKDFKDAAARLIDSEWLEPTVDFIDEAMSGSGSHDLGHLWRVLRNARRIADGEIQRGARIDWEVLAAAALLHDVVDLPKDHPERHLASTKSARAAVEHFERLGTFDDERREAIAHAVSAHSFSAGIAAESLESQILTDADRLESLGAFGIARTFYVSGELQRSICEMDDPFADHRELDDLEYAVDHFYTKLLRLRERFYTPTGKHLADKRHTFMERFLEQLADEIS